MDTISKQERSKVMSRVGSKNTRPELAVRSFLHRRGFRYSLHSKNLPGKPDIVLRKYKTAIFVHGCFWHGHDDPNCKLARTPKSRVEFWTKKVRNNKERDEKAAIALKNLGWNVVIVWECELKNSRFLESLPGMIKEKQSQPKTTG